MQQNPKSQDISAKINGLNTTIRLQKGKLLLRATSQELNKMFESQLDDYSLPQDLRDYGCEGVFNLIDESIENKRKSSINENGILKFDCIIKLGKKEIVKNITIPLRKQEGEVFKLKVKVQNLQSQIRKLKKLNINIHRKILSFEWDKNNAFLSKFLFNTRTISLHSEQGFHIYSLFSQKKLQNVQSFQFDIIKNCGGWAFGVAPSDEKGKEVNYQQSECICLGSKYIAVNKKTRVHGSDINNPCKIVMTVDMHNFNVKWSENFVLVTEVDMPFGFKDKDLYAVLHLTNIHQDLIQI